MSQVLNEYDTYGDYYDYVRWREQDRWGPMAIEFDRNKSGAKPKKVAEAAKAAEVRVSGIKAPDERSISSIRPALNCHHGVCSTNWKPELRKAQ